MALLFGAPPPERPRAPANPADGRRGARLRCRSARASMSIDGRRGAGQALASDPWRVGALAPPALGCAENVELEADERRLHKGVPGPEGERNECRRADQPKIRPGASQRAGNGRPGRANLQSSAQIPIFMRGGSPRLQESGSIAIKMEESASSMIVLGPYWNILCA